MIHKDRNNYLMLNDQVVFGDSNFLDVLWFAVRSFTQHMKQSIDIMEVYVKGVSKF